MTYELHQGDSREVLKGMADASVDSIVCDPPYHLTTGKKGGTGEASVNLDSPYGRARVTTGFMGMSWDGGDVANRPEVWAECLRVAKPGAWLLAFGGTRTFHRMACAIEDAGWELRDAPVRGHMHQPEDCPWLMGWMYGSGFPKSHNGDWGGTALKPAWEPIVCARKPLIGTVAENWAAHGTGALNIDACRIQTAEELRIGAGATWDAMHKHEGREGEPSAQRRYTEQGGTNFAATPGPRGGDPAGRWPANLIHDGSDEVVALFPESTSGAMRAGTQRAAQDEPGSVCFGTYGGNATSTEIAASSGSAARFFYCAKASKEDRNEGCQSIAPKQYSHDGRETSIDNAYQRNSSNSHPTVKPTDLMAYLCRLVTPPGGIVLDPFMGSGSTGKAAMLEGFNFIGIDLTPEYVEIARARIDFALRQGHQTSFILE